MLHRLKRLVRRDADRPVPVVFPDVHPVPAPVAADDGRDEDRFPPTAREARRTAVEHMRRVSPRTADAFLAEAPLLLKLLGETGFVTFADVLRSAGTPRHSLRLPDIFSGTVARLKLIEGFPSARAEALAAVAPLYARHPLLGSRALAVRADWPDLGTAGFSTWVAAGLAAHGHDAHELEAYVALEAAAALDVLRSCLPGLPLADAAAALRPYLRALTGQTFRVSPARTTDPSSAVGSPDGTPGVLLPERVALFADRDENFLLYKMLAVQAAGRHLCGTYVSDAPATLAAYDETRAFFEGLGEGAGGLSHIDFAVADNTAVTRVLPARPARIDGGAVLDLFPDVSVARALFDQIETARVLRLMRRRYRGVARDLDRLAEPLLASRRTIDGAHMTSAAVELLFRLALVGRVGGGVETTHGALVASLRDIMDAHLSSESSTVGDSLRATLAIFRMLPPAALSRRDAVATVDGVSPDPTPATAESEAERGDREPDSSGVESSPTPRERGGTTLPDASDRVFVYPEWDATIGDYRPAWCRVTEEFPRMELSRIPSTVDAAVVAALRRQFERLRPADPAWRSPLLDGEELATDALVAELVERRRRGEPTGRIHAARWRERRSVAALVLLDVSRSTGDPIRRDDPERRVIDCERDGLIAFAEALEAVGDRYAVCAFTSAGREAVRFLHVKHFHEKMCPAVRDRFASLEPMENTRLGAAVRHAARLLRREPVHTRLLILLSDGKPHDCDYGDVAYGVADSAHALREARALGIKTLSVTIEAGQDSTALETMFGKGRFAHIRDITELPSLLPRLYRRWTG